MSEELDKVKSVKYLPIFLWNDVAVPFMNTVKPVHFHKPADTALIKDVMRDNKLIGVCYSPDGALPATGAIGCVVEVTSKVNFKSGDSNVKFTGVVRFKIENFVEMNTAYPLAEVSFFEDEPGEDEARAKELSREIWRIFEQSLDETLKHLGAPKKTLSTEDVTPTPLPFSFLMGDLYSFDAEMKLELLESRSLIERLEKGVVWMKELREGFRDMNERDTFVKSHAKNKNNPNLS